MKINGLNHVFETYNTQKNKVETKKTDRLGENTDLLNLSSKAIDYQTAFKAAKATPDIRESKVSDIKNRIESGKYNVSAEEVSDKILTHFDAQI